MKSKNAAKGYRIGLVGLVLTMVLCVGVAVTSAADIGTTVNDSCSSCHNTKRICKMLGIKNQAAWNKTVTRMVDKGAPLSAAQIPAAVDYLTGLAPGSGPICQ